MSLSAWIRQKCILATLRVPEGWTLEALPRQPDHLLVTAPPPWRVMVTIDFRLRGFRQGCSITGPLAEDVTRRKQYKGRGWQQAIVDDAVTYLRAVLS